MKIFSSEQIKNWDAFTIKNEPVSSIDLMERAARAGTDWILQNFNTQKKFKIFCGKGNNGGDGLAIARMLIKSNCKVSVYIVETGSSGSPDFETNLKNLNEVKSEVCFLESEKSFPRISKKEIVIDCLFGTGLNKKPEGVFQNLINYLNKQEASIISIDIPSGLYTNKNSGENAIIRARYTITFQ